ncbi:MAG: class I SAM-dependent methyltransferase [Spirosomataceae bacterium]
MQSQNPMVHIYRVYAPIYYYLFGFYIQDGLNTAISKIKDNDKVLDIGVGTGLTLDKYPSNTSVVGIDLSPYMLEVAQKKYAPKRTGKTELLLMDAQKLDFEDESFDKVVMTHILSVLPEPKLAMKEAIRVCKKGGEILIVNHFSSDMWFFKYYEKFLMLMSDWIGFRPVFDMQSNVLDFGLEVLEIRPVNFWSLWHFVHLRKK